MKPNPYDLAAVRAAASSSRAGSGNCCYGGPVEKCGKEHCAYRDERAAASVVHVPRPISLVIEDSDGHIVASHNVAAFSSLDEMANWFAAHKQQDTSVIWKFVATGGLS